jgi:DNA-binding NarL/FixJ family response regulator
VAAVIRVLIVDDDALVRAGLSMMLAGTDDIRVVADDGLAARGARARELLDRLTDREREVAVAIGQGKSNAEIAGELYMSVATVKAHVSRLLAKLEVGNRVQIALLAHDAGVA